MKRFTPVVMVLLVVSGCGNRESSRSAMATDTVTSVADSTSPYLAAAWIRDYYRAIDERRYQDAYTHWEAAGRASGKSFQEFQRGFGQTERVEAIVGPPGPIGAAAGSRYIDVPVRVTARARDGAEQKFSGSYTLRLSVVDGATAEQRSWHIYSAKVRAE